MAWETFDMTSDKQEMDDMTADTTTPIAPSGGHPVPGRIADRCLRGQ